MKTLFPRHLASLAAALALGATCHAESLVFEIGTFDGSQAEFEQENNAYNDHQFYYEPGDYSGTPGNERAGSDYVYGYEVTEPEILSDGPLVGDEHPWADTLDGFPRALVPGRPVIDIFFQLTESEAASSAMKFETVLMWLGEGSSHDVTFYINNVPFYRLIDVRRDTPVEVYIPRNLPVPDGHPGLFQVGPNCLSIRRTGGGSQNPWIQFDALRLTAEVTAPTELIWQAGWFDNSAAEFEAEWDAYTDPRFHMMPGDYTDTVGRASRGVLFEGPGGEIWQDGPDELDPEDPEGERHMWARTLDGFPRALTAWRPTIDIYFKLTAEQAQKDYLAFHTILFGLGANSYHDVMAYLNGVPIAIGTGITNPLQVTVYIPRQNVRGPGYGPVFREGNNVLSLCRTGGGVVDPEQEVDQPWIQFDAVALTTVDQVSENVPAYRTVFSIGYIDLNVAEFEQESNAYNDPQYYAAAGDYTQVEGKSGWGMVWEGPAEIWQDSPEVWDETLDGFPRALVKEQWGRQTIDIFFQEPGAHARRYLFLTRFFNPGGESSHDVEFFLNGELIHTEREIMNRSLIEPWRAGPNGAFISVLLPAEAVKPGPNVLSMVRSGGSTTDDSWVVIDYVELLAELGEVVAPPPQADFAVTRVTRLENGAFTLEWSSEQGAVYNVQASSTLYANDWADVATGISGTAGTTSWTDTSIPAGTTHRYYRVVRTQ